MTLGWHASHKESDAREQSSNFNLRLACGQTPNSTLDTPSSSETTYDQTHNKLLSHLQRISPFIPYTQRQGTMSTVSTPNDSPVHVEPLHNPDHAAQIVVPQAPLGNATNGKFANKLPGMGAKALLAKKMAKSRYVSLRIVHRRA